MGYLACLLINVTAIVCCTYLAVTFNKWWIILIGFLFLYSYINCLFLITERNKYLFVFGDSDIIGYASEYPCYLCGEHFLREAGVDFKTIPLCFNTEHILGYCDIHPGSGTGKPGYVCKAETHTLGSEDIGGIYIGLCLISPLAYLFLSYHGK